MEAVALDPRLNAVLTRDQRFDGAFVYAVRSTGIFCRPSCASRRPRPERIAFFPSAGEARDAGFRACRRCQPDAAVGASSELAARVCRYIDSFEDKAPSLHEVAKHFGFSSHHLARAFKSIVGMTPKQYGDLGRAQRLKARLRTEKTVTDALYAVGYGSSSRLYERGSTLLGMTPDDYRRAGKGTSIGFTIVECRLGKLLVAASDRGICAVHLGDSESALKRGLHREFSAAQLGRRDQALRPIVKGIVAYLERGETLKGFDLDVAATAFTRSVWKALAEIPYGQTRTYGEIAAALGRPTAARAVARACATNNVALLIPCHRAVPRAGGAGGYRWGAARKRALLEREHKLA